MKWYNLVHDGTKMVIKWDNVVHNGSNYIREKHWQFYGKFVALTLLFSQLKNHLVDL